MQPEALCNFWKSYERILSLRGLNFLTLLRLGQGYDNPAHHTNANHIFLSWSRFLETRWQYEFNHCKKAQRLEKEISLKKCKNFTLKTHGHEFLEKIRFFSMYISQNFLVNLSWNWWLCNQKPYNLTKGC